MLKQVITTALLVAAAAGVQAAPTGWTVSGTISPAPCALSLTNSGNAEFQTLTSETVRAWPTLANPARYSGVSANYSKTLTLSVVCNTAARFALHFLDNSPTTVAGPAAETTSFGLGTFTNLATGTAANIGRYVVKYDQITIRPTTSVPETPPGTVLMTNGMASATNNVWTALTGSTKTYISSGKSIAYKLSSIGSLTPDPLLVVRGPLEFFLEPTTAVVDAATSSIGLSGAATITLIAL